jgi:hypothetical protein
LIPPRSNRDREAGNDAGIVQKEDVMRHMGLSAALLIGIVVAGVACSARAGSAAAQSAGTVDFTAYEETNTVYESLLRSIRGVSDIFGDIRDLAYNGLVAPNIASQGEHVRQVVLLLEGGEGMQGDLAYYPATPKYLLGESGCLGLLATSFEAYVSAVESYSDILSAFYGAKCGEAEYMPSPPDCSPAGGRVVLDSLLRRLPILVDRVTSLAEVALEATRRIDLQADPGEAANEFVAIYACAVTAEGYWPMLVGGHLPSPQTLPSTLHDLLDLLERIHADLADAMTQALYGS